MVDTLFGTSPTIGFADEAESPPISVANRIQFAVDGQIVFIRYWGPTNAITTSPKAAVWTTAGVLVNDPNAEPFPARVAGNWTTRTLQNPVTVTAGQTLDCGGGPFDRHVATGGVFATPVESGNLTGTDGLFAVGVALSHPDTEFNNNWYGIDVGFAPADAPSGTVVVLSTRGIPRQRPPRRRPSRRFLGAAAALVSAAHFRPNDGSGYWPDFSNTGYLREPAYPGSLTDWTGGMTESGLVAVGAPDGTTISYRRFVGKSAIGEFGTADDLTFVGCEFAGTQPNDNLVQIYSPTRVTFRFCTFRPARHATPPGNDGTVSSAPSAPGTPYADSWQYVANMVPTQAIFERCAFWGGAGIQCSGGLDADRPAIFRGCYIHDCADNDGSGGSGYHHDGVGPDSEGGGHDTLIERCTIASLGNTNAVALQGDSTYNRVTVRDCYLSGWGYALSIGATEPWAGTNIAVTGNVFSAELDALFGPLYGNLWGDGGGTNLWARNLFQVRAGDANGAYSTSDHDRYWWPTDNVSHVGDYAP